MRDKHVGNFVNEGACASLGLDHDMLLNATKYTYGVLDGIDATLTRKKELRLAQLLELANLSAIVGNLFRGGVAKFSRGRFKANGPHKYPDLICEDARFEHIEIKVALEDNNPKGHLVKPGPHITVRYVLGDRRGKCTRGARGDVIWIWEIRAGRLEDGHFNVSNTAGDSGKTAVVNKAGMGALKVVYFDIERCPHSPRGKRYAELAGY